MTQSVSLERLASTEYLYNADPQLTQVTPFGYVAHDSRFPDHPNAHLLFDCICRADEVTMFLDTVDTFSVEQEILWILGHDTDTYQNLKEVLPQHGWEQDQYVLLVHEHPPMRQPNAKVKIEVVDSRTHPAFTQVGLASGASPRAHAFRLAQDARVGGETFIAQLDGEAVGYGGWYVVNGVARFRRLGVLPERRRQGVGTAMIRYVQTHRQVQAQDALVILASHAGRQAKLYQQLGFIEHGILWSFTKSH